MWNRRIGEMWWYLRVLVTERAAELYSSLWLDKKEGWERENYNNQCENGLVKSVYLEYDEYVWDHVYLNSMN